MTDKPKTRCSPYSPVSCQLHSELELAIMRNQRFQLRYSDTDSQQQDIIITPVDIISRHGKGEFLLANNDSQEPVEIRLDQILQFKVI